LMAECHRSEAQAGHLQPGAAQANVIHERHANQ
jgi:hypothetical protein